MQDHYREVAPSLGLASDERWRLQFRVRAISIRLGSGENHALLFEAKMSSLSFGEVQCAMTDAAGTGTLNMDVAPPKRWRRFVPRWLRSLFWVDSAAGYDAFLSYSWSADKQIAPLVQSVLQQFLCPWYKVRAKTVFRDLSCLPAGSSLGGELLSRLDRSAHLIVLACPEAAQSRGMEMEAAHWITRGAPKGEIVVVVTAAPHRDGTASVSAGLDACGWPEIRDSLLPPTLRRYFSSAEPLWITLDKRRPDILGNPASERVRGQVIEDLKQLFLRLYPGLTWEELHGEERAQKRRAMGLMGAVIALFLAAGVAIAGEAIRANLASNAAARNYAAAVDTAKGTSAVVKDQVLPDGAEEPKSVMARNLLGVSYNGFRGIDPKSETQDGAYSRTQLFELLWNNYYILGDFNRATGAAQVELAIAQQHVTDSPSGSRLKRADWLRYMIRAQENLGDDARATGQLSTSDGAFSEALKFAQQLSLEPTNPWKSELPHAYERFGDSLRDQRRFTEALFYFKKFLDPLVAGSGTAWERNVAVIHGKMGDMYLELGDIGAAEREYQANLAISQSLLKPNVFDMQRGVAVAYEKFGYLRRRQHRFGDARRYYAGELVILKVMLLKDSADFQWRRDQALAREGLADVERDQEQYRAAATDYVKYLHSVAALLARSPDNARVRHDVAIAHERLGVLALRLGQSQEAYNELTACVQTAHGSSAAFDPRNREPADVNADCAKMLAQLSLRGLRAETVRKMTRQRKMLSGTGRGTAPPRHRSYAFFTSDISCART